MTLARRCAKRSAGSAKRRGRRYEFQMDRAAGAAGGAGDRRPDQDQPARPQIPPDRRGGDARRRQIGLRHPGGALPTAATAAAAIPAPRAMPCFVDLGGGKNLVALLAHLDESKLDLDAINYVALRAYNAAGGKRVNFNDMSKMTGIGAGEGRADPGAGELRRPGQSRDRPRWCRRTMRKPCWARVIRLRGSRPKWCRTASGRSISAARWASP